VWEPVLPVASQAAWADKELVDDLVRAKRLASIPNFRMKMILMVQVRCGVAAAAAAACATNLSVKALQHSAALDAIRASSSSKPAVVHVEQHKHTLDVTCSCHSNILKINTAHYNKLRHL
jgi:hypothetical protein